MKKFLIAAIIVAAFVKPTQATQLPDPTVCNGTLVRNHQGVLHLESTTQGAMASSRIVLRKRL